VFDGVYNLDPPYGTGTFAISHAAQPALPADSGQTVETEDLGARRMFVQAGGGYSGEQQVYVITKNGKTYIRYRLGSDQETSHAVRTEGQKPPPQQENLS
jgi:hypothetical protein